MKKGDWVVEKSDTGSKKELFQITTILEDGSYLGLALMKSNGQVIFSSEKRHRLATEGEIAIGQLQRLFQK